MHDKNKYEIMKVDVISEEQLDELYNSSALTFVGVSSEEESLNQIVDWLKEKTEISNPLHIYITSGKTMNENYRLTGDNAYPNNLTIISIKIEEIKNINAIVMARFEVGGRWFDDIVDNNAMREKEKNTERQKPKCALIGEDGNIFHLMGIASRTLRNNNMEEEAKEMVIRIEESKCYDEALAIISDYVEITSREDMEEDTFEG